MESLTPYFIRLQELRALANKLTAAIPSLVKIFEEEAAGLKRNDQVWKLKTLQSTLAGQFAEEKRNEESVKYSHDKTNLITSAGRLAVGTFISVTTKDKEKLSFANHLLKRRSDKQPPFGTILIGIGPGGFPIDVGVTNISQLAREYNRNESEIIRGLRENGYLFLNEQEFSTLINKLIEDINEGRLLLPIATDKLSEIINSSIKAPQVKYVVMTEPPNPE